MTDLVIWGVNEFFSLDSSVQWLWQLSGIHTRSLKGQIVFTKQITPNFSGTSED